MMKLALTLLLLAPIAHAAGPHDFDWELGKWKTSLKVRAPLSASGTWKELEGTSVVTPLLGGRANVVELVADGGGTHIAGASLRLYRPETQQWTLNFANAADGLLTVPMIGAFKDGRGEFYAQDTVAGRAVFVRFVITQLTPDSWRFEQAFSADGGTTWIVNWIATDTRIQN